MLILSLALFLLVQIVFLGVMIMLIHDQLTTQAPFVPLPRAVLDDVSQTIQLTRESVVYDLGCGDARVLIHLARENTAARFIGIEQGFIPYLIARIRTRNFPNISIHRTDMRKTDLSNATHIFTYLFPELMMQLHSKFNTELTPGCTVVTVDFALVERAPIATIPLNRDKRALAQTILVYKF
jgi:precorrin-6B methylase 2